ncbi:MAG: hypothetical protein AB7O44_29395 [Hyphomicrobiaceae bacterium]
MATGNAEPLARKVAERLSQAARALGAADPTPPLGGLLDRTFPLPAGDPRYGRNALTPMAAPFEPSFSELQPGKLRFTIEPLPPHASGVDRRDEATREMRRLVGTFLGRETLRWFDERSEPWRGFGGGNLDYGAFFGASTDRDGLYASKVYYEMQPHQIDQLPAGLFGLVATVLRLMPGLCPLFTTISAQRDFGGQRLTFAVPSSLKLADLGPAFEALGLGGRLAGVMQILGLVLGGRFELPPMSTLLAFGQTPAGPEAEIYVQLDRIPDLPAEFLNLLTLGLAERPRELVALSRWMSAFTPEDEVWPGRFSILSVRVSRGAAPRVSLYLRPVEFELGNTGGGRMAA